jgi:deazaflavin-dependent oxidoreductase (nitroreductase family)
MIDLVCAGTRLEGLYTAFDGSAANVVTSGNVTETPIDADSFKAFNKNIIEEFRANAGIVGGLLAGLDVLLLTTKGFKSAQPRLSPLVYFSIDGKMIVVGSYGGAEVDPTWVRNLRADPHAQIEVGTTGCEVIARELPTAEREETFLRVVAVAPRFGAYKTNTRRVIPLFELHR